MTVKRKHLAWSGPCGTVLCDIEEDGARTVHVVAIPYAMLTGKCCRRLAALPGWAAELVDDSRQPRCGEEG